MEEINGSLKNAIIIFVRKPELGKVKTRLAAQIGDEKALHIYKKLLEHTRRVSLSVECTRYVFVTEPLLDNQWDNFHEENQGTGNLGERMSDAFQFLFNKGYDKVIIIGSDCPDLSANIIDNGFALLETSDVVIGPAIDGGYYLLGIKKFYPELFLDKQWSTTTVLKATLESIEELQLSWHLLKELADVDVEADLPETWRRGL